MILYIFLVILFLLLFGSMFSSTYALKQSWPSRPLIYSNEAFLRFINLSVFPAIILLIVLLILNWKITLIVSLVFYIIRPIRFIIIRISEYIIIIPLNSIFVKAKRKSDVVKIDEFASQTTSIKRTVSDKVIKINPDDAYDWHDKGEALAELGKCQEAIDCYDEALRIDPEDAYVWHDKGQALAELGKYQEAIACYDEALRIDPEDILVKRDKKELTDRIKKQFS